jgi:Tn3 transposase DDE domain
VTANQLDCWTLILGPKFSQTERKEMNLSRFYAIGQIEYCRNFIFKRNFPIHKIFERGCEIALVSALRFGDPRVQALFTVLVIFSLQPQGFRNKDLRPLLAQALDLENQQITQGKMSCDLRRLTSPRINRTNRRIPALLLVVAINQCLSTLSHVFLCSLRGEDTKRNLKHVKDRVSGLNLLVAAIILWNTTYLQGAVDHLRNQGHHPASDDMAHLSPLGWEHINLTGDYQWDTSPTLGPDEFRLLRTHAHDFRLACFKFRFVSSPQVGNRTARDRDETGRVLQSACGTRQVDPPEQKAF